MNTAEFDTVVVGAGPAGSTLAIRLARSGFRVALVEKKRFPRAKPCGEFMSPACLPLLDDLGVGETIRSLGAHLVRGMRLYGFGRQAQGRYGPLGRVTPRFDHGLAVRRDRFDDALFRAAAATGGVRIYEGFAATSLLWDGDAVRGVTIQGASGPVRLGARFTVGADGLRSRVASILGVRRPVPGLDKFALVTRYAGIEARDSAELHFFPGGYFVGCPVDGGLFSLNLVVDQSALRAAGCRAEDFLHRRLQLAPDLERKLAAGTRIDAIRGTGPLAGGTTRQTFDGAALVGDACGFLDPVTGEGIFFALRGAADLADSLVAALHAGRTDRRSLAGYLRARRQNIVARVRFARLLQLGLRHPWLTKTILRLLESRPRLTDTLVTLTGDYARLREVWRKNNGARIAS